MAGMTLSSSDVLAMRAVIDACGGADGDEPGLPAPAMQAMRELIPCDELDILGMDWRVLGHYLWQTATDDLDEVAVGVPERYDDGRGGDAFWPYFWTLHGSYPERSGDYTSVFRGSDVISDREMETDYRFLHNMIARGFRWETGASWPDGPGHSVRIVFWRGGAMDFTERELFILSLLRPHLAAAYWTSNQATPCCVQLTPRQREILGLVALGRSNIQIARALGVSEGTVRTHLNNIYGRLEVTSRSAAVAKLFGQGRAAPSASARPGRVTGLAAPLLRISKASARADQKLSPVSRSKAWT
ncbi:MAG: hypothetical protein QOI51_164 [Nocardioidaceae bacterium]|nr:hypothetical protein [Nocardioidaceae bacterium]